MDNQIDLLVPTHDSSLQYIFLIKHSGGLTILLLVLQGVDAEVRDKMSTTDTDSGIIISQNPEHETTLISCFTGHYVLNCGLV